jgi:hypothetical protein
VELNKEILYNKGCVQNMVQMLLSFDDPDVSSPAQAALKETNKAASQSCNKIKRTPKETKNWANQLQSWQNHRYISTRANWQ